MSNSVTIKTSAYCGATKTMQFKGREAQTMKALIEAGERGITAAEVSNWAFRLSAYIHSIKKKQPSLDIVMKQEQHEGGKHARYILNDSADYAVAA